jgi:hypothetical protein
MARGERLRARLRPWQSDRLVALALSVGYVIVGWGIPAPSIWTIHGKPVLWLAAGAVGLIHVAVWTQETRILFVGLLATAPLSRVLSLVIQQHGYSSSHQAASIATWSMLALYAVVRGRERVAAVAAGQP